MSILIKGMKMPVTCCHCPLMGYDPGIEWNDGGRETKGAYICIMTHELIDNTKREEHCPLIELPPHGRLIDESDILEDMDKNVNIDSFNGYVFRKTVEIILDNAPTVIEAEGTE